MMTLLLWARPVFAVILFAVLGLYVWAGRNAEAKQES